MRRWTPCDSGTEPDLRNVDLADVRSARRRRRPRWNAPVNSPTPWVFAAAVVAIILTCFAALELAEYFFTWWGWR